MSQVSSVAFCCGLSESCPLKESYSVYFYLHCGYSFFQRRECFLEDDVFKGKSNGGFLYPCILSCITYHQVLHMPV